MWTTPNCALPYTAWGEEVRVAWARPHACAACVGHLYALVGQPRCTNNLHLDSISAHLDSMSGFHMTLKALEGSCPISWGKCLLLMDGQKWELSQVTRSHLCHVLCFVWSETCLKKLPVVIGISPCDIVCHFSESCFMLDPPALGALLRTRLLSALEIHLTLDFLLRDNIVHAFSPVRWSYCRARFLGFHHQLSTCNYLNPACLEKIDFCEN